MEEKKKNMYPVFLSLAGRKCLVVGGGGVAVRKIAALVRTGADVTVVAPDADKRIQEMAGRNEITWERRQYGNKEAADYFIVVAATDSRSVNTCVSKDAREAGRLVNAVDMPDLCDFYVPSVITRGELQIAMSTSGACPAMARKIREDLESMFPETYGPLLARLREFRKDLMEKVPEWDDRKRILAQVAGSAEVEKYLQGDCSPLEEMLSKCIS